MQVRYLAALRPDGRRIPYPHSPFKQLPWPPPGIGLIRHAGWSESRQELRDIVHEFLGLFNLRRVATAVNHSWRRIAKGLMV